MGLYEELTSASSVHQSVINSSKEKLYTFPSKINSCQLCVRGYC